MKKLAPFRQTANGFVDLLNYAAVVDDGVIVNKNGSFMAAWRYEGVDAESSVEKEKEVVAFRVNQALSPLKNGWAIHVDVVRRPTDPYSPRGLSHFPDPVTRAMDEERRAMFSGVGQAYLQAFYLTVTWFPPMLAERKFVELMFDDDRARPSNRARSRDLIGQFQQEVAALEARLSLCFRLERLKGRKAVNEDGSTVTQDAFLSHLWRCVSGRDQPVLLPDNPIYLDTLFGQEMHGGVIPRVGDLPTLPRAKREVLDAAVREFRGVARIVRASTSMTLTEQEGVPVLNDLRARFTLTAANPSQREELTERAGWIGVELSGNQTRAEQKQWQALARDLLERRPGFNPEQFVARATRVKAQERGEER